MNNIKSFIHAVDTKCTCDRRIQSRVDSNSSEVILTLRAVTDSDNAILEHLPEGASLLKLRHSQYASIVLSSPCNIYCHITYRFTHDHQNKSVFSIRLSKLLSTDYRFFSSSK